MGTCFVSDGGLRVVVELSCETEVFRVCLVTGGLMEGALPVEVVRACREVVLGRLWRPVEAACSVGVLEPLRTGTPLWLSEDSGGLLTDGLLLSELRGGLVVTDLGGRIEPSLDPG